MITSGNPFSHVSATEHRTILSRFDEASQEIYRLRSYYALLNDARKAADEKYKKDIDELCASANVEREKSVQHIDLLETSVRDLQARNDYQARRIDELQRINTELGTANTLVGVSFDEHSVVVLKLRRRLRRMRRKLKQANVSINLAKALSVKPVMRSS